jgi:hypothetical protein
MSLYRCNLILVGGARIGTKSNGVSGTRWTFATGLGASWLG